MTPIMKRTEKDDAVSPVVGVMLMLVVTIIIAAVVAAFASGVATQTEAAPNVMLKANVNFATPVGDEDGKGVLYLTSINGETIDLSKVTITLSGIESGYDSEPPYAPFSNPYTYKFESPVHSYPAGQFLKSGQTLNCGYGVDSQGGSGDCALSQLLPVGDYSNLKAGDAVHVTVVYDGTHLLYDKDVIAE